MSHSGNVITNNGKDLKITTQRGKSLTVREQCSNSDGTNNRHKHHDAVASRSHAGMPQSRSSPLRRLLGLYYLLDAISRVKVDIVNSCLDQVRSEPPSRPLAERIVCFNDNSPRSWLGIRNMIRNFYTDVLYAMLDIVYEAIALSDQVLCHTPSDPILSLAEQRFAAPTLFDGIRVRKHVLRFLYHETKDFIDRLTKLTQKEAGGGDLIKSSVNPTTVGAAAVGCDVHKWFLLIMSRHNSLRHSVDLPATVYCNAYWSLLYVLYKSSWPSSFQIKFLSFQSSVQDLQRLRINPKPFPGVWTCRAGVVLWRPAFS
ncbi:hypothetical protein N7G274_006810 [Stereocaulon virgatum]|uniref:Uncharacterized protein n=1 Tax=Stereocaulon virgatum TaxID=373712 RepID=A0ABR4A7J6_9LECA